MPQNFLPCERDQPLVLPRDLRDRLPEDHLAWFVIASAQELDLSVFYAAHRADGHGASVGGRASSPQPIDLCHPVGDKGLWVGRGGRETSRNPHASVEKPTEA